MITSIVLTGKYHIGISNTGKIKLEDKIISLKEIPFIRYRFNEYGADEVEFIRQNKERFKGPVHLAEVTLSDNTKDVLESLDTIPNIAKYVYISIDDSSGEISQETKDNLTKLGDTFYDRLMIKDNNSLLYPLMASKLKIELENYTPFSHKEIGVCGSTFSFKSENTEIGDCCLTALKARELLALYAETDDVPIPTATHESMNCCGCIRYKIVSSDIPAPEGKVAHKKSTEAKNTDSDKAKEPKAIKPKGRVKPTWF